MALRRPLVLVAGQLQELPSGDTLPGASLLIGELLVDFGSTPVRSKRFTATISGALTSQRAVVAASLNMPSGMVVDELEMDMIACAARVSAADTLEIIATALPGPVRGQRRLAYHIG